MHSGAVVHLNKQQQQQQQQEQQQHQQEQQQHQQEQQKAGSSNQGVISKQHAAADSAKQKWEEFWASELPAGALID
jgi:transcription initiation factor TFIID subunit TAF12